MKDLLLRISERLMRSPAAPYHEELVASEVIAICRELELFCKPDSFGNLILSAAKRPAKAPIVLAAHMDHPGFRIHRQISPTQFAADFLGGVGDSYFKPGTLLRLMPGNIPASLSKRIDADKRTFEIQAASNPSAPPRFAVWDLPEFSSDNNRITGRVCDDLIGCATILTVLATLRGSPSAANVIGALTRAEEVGFHGAPRVGPIQAFAEKVSHHLA